MLPGWMMPIDELINNVLSAPPHEAARVLVALPPTGSSRCSRRCASRT